MWANERNNGIRAFSKNKQKRIRLEVRKLYISKLEIDEILDRVKIIKKNGKRKEFLSIKWIIKELLLARVSPRLNLVSAAMRLRAFKDTDVI